MEHLEKDTIRFAVIGLGRIGQRHVGLLSSMPGFTVLAGVDIEKDKKSILGEEAQFYTSLEDFIQHGLEVDVVSVCTPNGYHAPHAIALLEAGFHVVIEKPMALSLQEAEHIITASLHSGKKVFCVMQNRYSPPSKWAKELITSGKLGRIYHVQINCFWNRDERYYTKDSWHGSAHLDGGTLFTQFSHFVDTLYWLFGDVKVTAASFSNHNHKDLIDFEDSGNIIFEHSNGARGIFSYSTSVYDQNLESSLMVIAEKGSFKIGGQYMEKVEQCHIENYLMPALAPSNPPNTYGGYVGSAANHQFVFENVKRVLLSQDSISTNAMEGLKVVQIIEKFYESNPFLRPKLTL